jgi:DNA primase
MDKQYLASRGFDPGRLEQEWDLQGTGPISSLDGKDYRFRIIVPIYWGDNPVSFQGRYITDRHQLRYKACPKDRETIHHKWILYGDQRYWSDTGIIVEGITDVWRFGPMACATFGIEFTNYQVSVIGKTFDRIFIVFDDDLQAKKQARKLKRELLRYYRYPQIEIVSIPGDPGGMDQSDANYLIKQLIN